jgi:site-specific recombinase XerD
MLDDMQIRNLADNTQKSYLLQVSSFARHFRRSPELLGPEEIRAWLVHLREERKLAPGSLGPTIGALRFLYRVTLKRPWSDEDFPLPKKPFMSNDTKSSGPKDQFIRHSEQCWTTLRQF